jgi:ATP-binding cassette subfamily C exporter for protease/lipase
MLGIGALLTLLGVLSPEAGGMLIVAKLIGALAIRPMMQLISSWKMVVGTLDAYRSLKNFLLNVPVRGPDVTPFPYWTSGGKISKRSTSRVEGFCPYGYLVSC